MVISRSGQIFGENIPWKYRDLKYSRNFVINNFRPVLLGFSHVHIFLPKGILLIKFALFMQRSYFKWKVIRVIHLNNIKAQFNISIVNYTESAKSLLSAKFHWLRMSCQGNFLFATVSARCVSSFYLSVSRNSLVMLVCICSVRLESVSLFPPFKRTLKCWQPLHVRMTLHTMTSYVVQKKGRGDLSGQDDGTLWEGLDRAQEWNKNHCLPFLRLQTNHIVGNSFEKIFP